MAGKTANKILQQCTGILFTSLGRDDRLLQRNFCRFIELPAPDQLCLLALSFCFIVRPKRRERSIKKRYRRDGGATISQSLETVGCIRKFQLCVHCASRFEIDLLAHLWRRMRLPRFAEDSESLVNFPRLDLQPRVMQERGWKHRRLRCSPSNLLEFPDRFFAATGAQFALREIPSRKSASRLRGIARPLFQFVTWWRALGAVTLIQLGENLRQGGLNRVSIDKALQIIIPRFRRIHLQMHVSHGKARCSYP